MIASNYRKHPAALALQLPLPFGHLLRWALPRPGARILRAIRVARAEAFKAAGRVAYPIKRTVPTWYAEARKRARQLANQVKGGCLAIFGEVLVATSTTDTDLIGFKYEQDLDQAIADAESHGNRYRAAIMRRRKERGYNTGKPRLHHPTHTTTLTPAEAPWNQANHDALMAKRHAALDTACPACDDKRFGYGPDWKRGVWNAQCMQCGHAWTIRIPHL